MKDIKSFKNIKDNKSILEKEYKEALKDSYFKKLVSSLKLEDEELMKYTSKLIQAAEELKNSEKDDRCLVNEIPGFIFTPYVVDGELNFTYKASKAKKEEITIEEENSMKDLLKDFK